MKKLSINKDGAALVITLGFLAILTIMIFAFAVRTRTERLASRSYLDNARANQLLHTALAHAMEHIDLTFGTNYPNRFALSSGNEVEVPISENINFSTEENYLPLGNIDIENAYLDAVDTANWLPISHNNINIGRVAYVVVNTSGLLDANAVGAVNQRNELHERANGLTPKEIQLSPELLPELNTSAQLVNPTNGSLSAADSTGQALVHNRDNAWNRFETLRDLKTLNTNKLGGAIGGKISSFNVFSLYPTTAFQGMELTEPINEQQFKKDFENILTSACGFDVEEANHISENYLDYIDADSIPRNLYGSSPEAVPMINEIWVDNFDFNHEVSDRTNVTYSISGQLHIETWYPFDDPLSIENDLQLIPSIPSSNDVEIITGEEFTLVPGYITVVVAYTNLSKALIIPLTEIGLTTTDDLFYQYSYEFEYNDRINFKIPLSSDDAEFTSFHLLNKAIEMVENDRVENDPDVLDRVEDIELKFDFLDEEMTNSIFYSCYDPRLNHYFADWVVRDNSTPNEINDLDDWGEEEDLVDKNKIRFFVSNQPMTNAAELGHLSTGQPWDTIRLYAGGETLDPVLDHFYTATNTEPTRPGLININSPHTNVLATAFYKAPLSNQSPFLEITANQALVLGQTLASLSGTANNNISHIGNALTTELPDWESLTDTQKDSIVGNTYRLFGSRDSSYTILLVAQTGTDFDNNGLDDEEITSSQQAIVHVWRDPTSQKAAVTFFGLTDTLRSTFGGDKSWDEILLDFKP